MRRRRLRGWGPPGVVNRGVAVVVVRDVGHGLMVVVMVVVVVRGKPHRVSPWRHRGGLKPRGDDDGGAGHGDEHV